MKRLFAVVVPAVLALFVGCAPTSTTIRTDSFTGITYTEMAPAHIYSGLLNYTNVWARFVLQDSTPNFQVVYTAPDWLFVQKLYLKIDGVTYQSSECQPIRDTQIILGKVIVRESAYFPIKSTTMEKIAAAKAFSIRLIGDSHYFDIDVSAGDIQDFTTFYNTYVVPKTAKTSSL